MAEPLRQAYDYWQDQPECEMAEPLRQAYDYWQDQPGWFSTEMKEQNQTKAMKTIKNKKKQSKTNKNKQKQATTSKNKQLQERGCQMAESLRQAYDYWQDQPGWFSTEMKKQNQTKAMKTIKNNKKQPKTNTNKQKQATTSNNKQQQERGCQMAESLRQAYDYWQDQPEVKWPNL
jgi:hypothetical protein